MRALDPQDPATTYAAVLDALPIVAFMARPDGVVSYVSRGWQQFTGTSAERILRDGYQVYIHPEDLGRVGATWDAARSKESPYRDEFRLLLSDGSFRWILSQADPVRDGSDRIVAWFGTVTDISDRIRTESALAESDATYRAISAAIPGVTWAASPQGELTFVSDQWITLHGKPREGALGEAWLESVHPEDREDVLAVWSHSILTGDPYDTQFRIRLATGDFHWFLVRALPVRNEAGSIVRWVGVNVDIEERRRADEAREQFVRLIEASDDFIGIGDTEGNATYVNEAGRRMLGIGSMDDARRTNLSEYFTSEDLPFVEGEILPTIARDGRWIGDFRLRHFGTGEAVPVWYNVFSLTDERGRNAGIATVSRDLRSRLRVEAGMHALAGTGPAMFRSLYYAQTLRNVAEAVTREFATYCVIDMIDAHGQLQCVATAHGDSALAPALARAAAARSVCGEHPVARAMREGVSTLVPAIPTDWVKRSAMSPIAENDVALLDARSMVCVPIFAPNGRDVMGALSCIVDRRDVRGAYTENDLRFAEELARRAAVAFDHARAYERERRIAVTLQEASLPKTLPHVRGARLSAEYRPGNDEATIGGDWYDAFLLKDGRLAVTVGDVLGNGLGAAVTMGKVRQAMRAVAAVEPNPNLMLDVADETVRAESEDTYATALAGIVDFERNEFVFASAGHPGPALRRPDGSVEDLTSPGLLLGLRERDADVTETAAISPGSALVFFTDGLVEATRDLAQGYARLHAAMADPRVSAHDNRARALVEHVMHGNALATDDIAVLVVEIANASALPAASFDSVSRRTR